MAAAEGLPQDLVFVDLETTGGSAAYDRITEVGLVRVTNGEIVEEWSSPLWRVSNMHRTGPATPR